MAHSGTIYLSTRERNKLESDALLYANIRCLELLDRALFAVPQKTEVDYGEKCRDLITQSYVHMKALNIHKTETQGGGVINNFINKYGLSAEETRYARLRIFEGVPFSPYVRKRNRLEIKEVISLIHRLHDFGDLLGSNYIPKTSVLMYVNEFIDSLNNLDVQEILQYVPKWEELVNEVKSINEEFIENQELVKKMQNVTSDFGNDLNSKVVNNMTLKIKVGIAKFEYE